MKITFDLPEYDNAWGLAKLFPEAVVRFCYGCEKSTDGPMVCFARSWWHVSCLESAFARRVAQDSVLAAWIHVAIDVGRYPSKHTASEIRAVIQNLIAGPMMTALWRAGREEARDLRGDVDVVGPQTSADYFAERDGDSHGDAAVAH